MKAVMIFHNAASDEVVTAAMGELGIEQYSRFPGTLGKGALSEPHLNIRVWPEVNNATMVVTDEPTARALMDKVRQMRKTQLAREGIKAFMWHIEDMTE
jgi:hypothetical protein